MDSFTERKARPSSTLSRKLHEDDDDDNDDDLLDFETSQPFVTTYESMKRKPRKGRVGKFGSNNTSSSRKQHSNAFTKLNNNNNSSSSSIMGERDQESGTLADESSPEFSRTRTFSEDETCNFGSMIPQDLLAAEQQSWPRNLNSDLGASQSSLFSRSTSSIASTTSKTTSRRSLQRSRSVNGGTSVSGFPKTDNNSVLLSWSAMKGDEWGENTDPNLDEVVEDTGRERKKIRARRHSLLGTVSSTTSMSRTSSTSTRSSLLSQDPDLIWLAEATSTTPSKLPLDLGRHLEDEVNSATAFTQAHSPTATRSVASSRKRGVCGSPILSDQDDWLTQSGSSCVSDRRTRSRSRIFSPPPGEALPLPPNLSRCDSGGGDNNNNYAQHHHHPRRDAMDVDDDSDDESCKEPSSPPDSSFEMMDAVPGKTEKKEPTDDKSKIKHVLDTMPSYQDLKFLIKRLKEQKKVATAGSWQVAPPIKGWKSQRRSSFINWAKESLGFAVRSMGQGITYLQISNTRGAEFLNTLEGAKAEYKHTKALSHPGSPREETQEPLFVLPPSAMKRRASTGSFTSSSSKQNVPSSTMDRNTMEESSPAQYIPVADDADSLANKISALSMNEPVQSARSSLPRLVTLPLQRDVKEDTRLSVESIAGSSNARPSLGSHGAATDLNLHLFGESPRMMGNTSTSTGRPPKMSFGSMGSAGTAATMGRGSSSIAENTVAPCATVNFVATPLMTQTRGWGSRPVVGRDWGSTAVYDETRMVGLISRFRTACIADGGLHSFETDQLGDLRPRSSSLVFSMDEASPEDEEMAALAKKEEARRDRKRRSSFNKRKRMSLFATATGAAGLRPRQNFSMAPAAETILELDTAEDMVPAETIAKSELLMGNIFSFMDESCLLSKASATCTQWADWATDAHVNLLLASLPIQPEEEEEEEENDVESLLERRFLLERSWNFLHGSFPWACYLAEGGAKKVYRVHNSLVGQEEALSVMDTSKSDPQVVANELAISAMLSSLVRRAICPNFVAMRGVFTCAHAPPESLWGSEDYKYPNGKCYDGKKVTCPPQTPTDPRPGQFQFIRMELVNEGDAEELIKRQPGEALIPDVSRALLFQTAFALHAAADKFSVKHYDIKLLNVFVQNIQNGEEDVLMRYSLGSHIFQLRMPAHQAFMAKLADFGTANTVPATNGQPVTIAQITTLENTPPDFMILGDEAKQGHEHDSFGLGLCMLHLFTGHRPYEEILEDVKCPWNLKKRLRKIWENEKVKGYSVIQSIVLEDVEKDESGHTIDGDPNEVFYDTLYRFLVLFGIPKDHFQQKSGSKVWKAITDSLESASAARSRGGGGKPFRKRSGSDITQFNRDCKKFSIRNGNNKYIARARWALQSIDGGMELLLRLCSFNPANRATALQVLNSSFMEDLRIDPESTTETTPYSYTSFATHS